MINVQDPRFQCLRYEATCVEWDDTTTLRAFVEGLFPHSRWVVTAQTSRLGPHFTAAFMHRVCGLKIKWTTSIHDHLRLDRCEKLLSVFPYKCYLQALIEGYQYSEERDRSATSLFQRSKKLLTHFGLDRSYLSGSYKKPSCRWTCCFHFGTAKQLLFSRKKNRTSTSMGLLTSPKLLP